MRYLRKPKEELREEVRKEVVRERTSESWHEGVGFDVGRRGRVAFGLVAKEKCSS